MLTLYTLTIPNAETNGKNVLLTNDLLSKAKVISLCLIQPQKCNRL